MGLPYLVGFLMAKALVCGLAKPLAIVVLREPRYVKMTKLPFLGEVVAHLTKGCFKYFEFNKIFCL